MTRGSRVRGYSLGLRLASACGQDTTLRRARSARAAGLQREREIGRRARPLTPSSWDLVGPLLGEQLNTLEAGIAVSIRRSSRRTPDSRSARGGRGARAALIPATVLPAIGAPHKQSGNRASVGPPGYAIFWCPAPCV